MTEPSLFDLYALFCVNGIGNRKLNRLLQSDLSGFEGVTSMLTKSPEEIKEFLPGLGNRDIESLKNLDLETVQAEYDQLSCAGIELVCQQSNHYPRALVNKLELDAPPMLFCLGNLEILNTPAISIVGSRDVSDRGKEIAAKLVEAMSDRNVTIISGGAKGIDAAAHNAAVECGLGTIIVTPYGINKILAGPAQDTLPAKALFISQFHPNSNWKPAFAMIRNKTVCALSKAIFVVEAGESGGTINTGEVAAKMGMPVYVLSPDEFEIPPPGNRYLISQGGREISLESTLDSIGDLIA
jgi:DNA processing protein